MDMEVSGRRPNGGSDDVNTGLLCDPCMTEDEQTNAEFYCSQCNEFLCGICARVHRRSKATKHHQLRGRDEMPQQKLPTVGENLCPDHKGKLIEYYCSQHKACCCSVCITLNHNQCGAVYIDDLAKNYDTSLEYKDVLRSIKGLEEKISNTTKQSETRRENAKTNFDEITAEIRKFRTEINARLDILEREIMLEAEQNRDNDIQMSKEVSSLCASIGDDLTRMSSRLKSLETFRQNQQLFIATKDMQIKVRQMQENIDTFSQGKEEKTYHFKRDENIMTTLHSVTTLGSLEFACKTGIVDTMSRLQLQDTKPKTVKVSKTLDQDSRKSTNDDVTSTTDKKSIKYRFVGSINMKQPRDKDDCGLTGIVQVNANELAVADCLNRSVKIVDITSNIVTTQYNLDDKPWDITCMNQSMLVVTCYSRLVFLKHDGKMSLVKKLMVEPGVRGITSHSRKLFITRYGYQPSVQVLSDEGNVLQTFQHDDEGQNIFRNPNYITLSNDGQTMFVSDYSLNSVISLNLSGKVCNVYKHDDLISPLGLTVDKKDNIFVAGNKSHSIHCITPQCTHTDIVLQNGEWPQHPQAVLYITTNNYLYISTSVRSTLNNMYVYKLE